MISLYRYKTRFQALLRPVAGGLHRRGITANQVTLTTCVVSVGLGIAAAAQPASRYLFVLIALWCLMRMAANALDGMLAREYGQATPLGAQLNEAGDIVADIALSPPFAAVAASQPWPVVLLVALAVCGELIAWLGTRTRAQRANHGPMGKSDRALVFGVTALLIGCGVSYETWINTLWWCVIALLCLTIVQRVRYLAALPVPAAR